MLVVMIGVRKSLDCIFTRRELKILDDIMPEITKRAAADDLHHLEDGTGEVGFFSKCFSFCIRQEKATPSETRRLNIQT